MKTPGSRTAKLFSDPAALVRAVEAARKQRSAAEQYVAPRSQAEQVLAEIWAALLRVDRVGAFDDFFKSGGHSLLAAQMLARVRKQAGVELPLQAVFAKPVLADLAQEVERGVRPQQGQTQPRPEHIPLSSAQEQMWFLNQLEAGSPVYHVAQLIEVGGTLDRGALRSSVQQLVARHESLRTVFRVFEDRPEQVVLPELALEPQWIELSPAAASPHDGMGAGSVEDETDTETLVQHLAGEARRLPYDLEHGPLLRITVFAYPGPRSWLLLEMHHIISDRWSFEIFTRELFACYQAAVEGRVAPLTPLELQYADASLWQRARLADAGFEDQLAYWREQLRDTQPLLELPLDRPRPALQAHRGAVAIRLLPRSLVDRLLALGEEQGATLFMTLLAGLQLLLARLSGQEDIVVGSPIANRTRTEFEGVIGLFVNTLALRARVEGDLSFAALLDQVRRTAINAFAHASLPFDRVVEMLAPERSLSYNPVFQVMFAYQGQTAELPQCRGLQLKPRMLEGSFSTFDLLWSASTSAAGTLLRVEYDTDLFDTATIEAWLGSYERLLDASTASPGTSIAALPLMDDQERETVLRLFNANLFTTPDSNTPDPTTPDAPALHCLFEQKAQQQPEATAVVWGEQRVGYGELNARANRLAHHMIALGVTQESTVAVFLPRAPDLLMAILAVLKAGGAYVPLDPRYPRERLRAILDDAQVRLILTDEKLCRDLPECTAEVLALDALDGVLARQPSSNPALAQNAGRLAYVLFTSGSTGRPKGVAIEHRSALALLAWVQATFAPESMAGMLFSTSICFDLSVFEIFGPLSLGGWVLIADDALALPGLSARNEVTFINTVPSAIAELIRADAVPSSVKVIALAGEALAQSLVDEIYQRTQAEVVYNLYGPTEDTTYSTAKELPPGAMVTIGRPIAGTQAYVLDARRQPVPMGVAGELYLAGAGLARGYYGQPALTAERFLSNPFSTEPGARMYRTGDLCRWRRDGQLDYLGRMDGQVKLRGFRIELGEIEAVLAGVSGIRQCLAAVWEQSPGHRMLVAYVVASDGAVPAVPGTEDLRAALRQRLPEFMIPAAFVWLEQFPLSPNGKIDRRRLPAPQSAAAAEEESAPRNALEQQLCEIWAEVLRCPLPGIHQDFFALGGHSLLATQVVSRVRNLLGVELPLREIFQAPTIAELATRVEPLQRTPSAAVIRRAVRGSKLPLSFAQQRLWFLDQLEPDSPLYNTPMAIRIRGELRPDLLERSIEQLVARHEVLRTTFAVEGDRPVQVVAPTLFIPVRLIDLQAEVEAYPGNAALDGQPSDLDAAASRVAVQAAAMDAAQRFDLSTGPLLRATLLRLGAHEHVLLLTTHHIVNDGWSMPTIMRELKLLYEAFLAGRPTPLRPMDLQYGDYAVWQLGWMESGVGESQLAYWKQLLAGAPDTVSLPTDRKPAAERTRRGGIERLLLPRSLTAQLNAFSRAENATLYMTLLAAYQVLLFRYSHQEDIVVGTPIAGRTRAELEELIGFFVNTLALRTDLSGDPTFRDLLGRVRALCMSAYANQDLPFERIVEALHPDRDASRTPLFQVWFALQNLPRAVYEISGLVLEPMAVHNGTAKFDLALFVAETAEGLACTVEYATDLFDPETIQAFLRHYAVLLGSIVAGPAQRISVLPLLDEAERADLIVGRNQTLGAYDVAATIDQIFEQQAALRPDAVAAVCAEQELSYASLNARANQVAHRLRAMGIGPEGVVAICLEPSLEMLVAILGVLKAGGAYLPIDTSYPEERQAFMLRDAAVSVVIASPAFSAALPAGAARLHLDETAALSAESTENPATLPDTAAGNPAADALAYIIYTSGSTGTAKGVMIPHRNVVRLLQATDAWFGFGPQDTWTLFHSIAFDFSVWEIWGALLYGGRLIVVPRLVAQAPDEFHDLLVRQQVTVLNQTPSAFRQLIEADQRSAIADSLALRAVIFGGEALELRTLGPWIAKHPQAPALINMYGITETTVHVTYFPIPAEAIASGQGSLIGTRIPDLETYILDAQGEPVPVGVPGELYVGGAGLARGYLDRPALTAERFLPHPFRAEPGARVYRTGDQARWLRDGGMEYYGRIDDQVKIRGYRIELGEVEATLEAHAGVSRAVVMAREDRPGEKRLVAYVVASHEARETARDAGAADAEQVSQWALAFDEVYASGGTTVDPTFNITGWDSSYTGTPIPPEEMREWVDATVERIAALAPRRLWEIGCGTGLLLLRLAPGCEHYLGTDISATSLRALADQLSRNSLAHVELRRGAAHESVPTRAELPFDTVVLNSVVQYFPSVEYLLEVLGTAIASLGDGGSVFIGDVRNVALEQVFHTSVELSRAPDGLPVERLRHRIQASRRQEAELLLAPEFFLGLRELYPQVERVEIQLKRGHAANELTLFRYDVVVHVGAASHKRPTCAWLDWRGEQLSAAELRARLASEAPALLGIHGIPNARLVREIAALASLETSEGVATVAEIRGAGVPHAEVQSVHPEELWAIAQDLPYSIELRPSRIGSDGLCDALFRRVDEPFSAVESADPVFPGAADAGVPLSSYANRPLARAGAEPLAQELRRWIGEKLPPYMVPSAFVMVDAIPLTSNGKVNRKALPAPDEFAEAGRTEYVAPRNPMEERIAAIWEEVLHLDRVGVEDDFFALGGHSLSATQVIIRLRQAFQVNVSLKTFFAAPQVARLAESVELLQRGQADLVVSPVVRAGRSQPIPLSFAQQRLWFLAQLEPDSSLYNVPRAYYLDGPLDVAALQRALDGVVERHEILRTTYAVAGDEPVQIVAPHASCPLRVEDLRGLSDNPAERERAASRLAQQEADRPFALGRDCMLRGLLLHLGEGRHLLVLNTHHIASDGWSGGVLLDELSILYNAALENAAAPASLPALPIQNADYAVWQRTWLTGPVLDRQLAYWRARLTGAPPVLRLPADRPRPAAPGHRGAVVHTVIPAAQLEGIQRLSTREGATPFMTLLAAFYSVLFYLTGETDLVVGTDVANRSTAETEALIGFFVNLLVLRTGLEGDPSFAALLRRVRTVALGAYTHQDIVFDKLVEELQPERSLTHNPLVQVLFVEQNTPRRTSGLEGVSMTPHALDVPSKFDLALFVRQTDAGLDCRCLFKAELFAGATVERWMLLYQAAIETVVAHSEIPLSGLLHHLKGVDEQHRASEHAGYEEQSVGRLRRVRRQSLQPM